MTKKIDKCDVRKDVDNCKGCDFCGRMTAIANGWNPSSD